MADSQALAYRRPTFAEIEEAIRRTFPMLGQAELGLSPDSLASYFAAGGTELPWEPIHSSAENFTAEEFMSVLFSPLAPKPEETIYAVTDECIWEGRQLGFALAFKDLIRFAKEVYPAIMWRPMDFFQLSDTIFFAEASRLLILLHHEGGKVQFTL